MLAAVILQPASADPASYARVIWTFPECMDIPYKAHQALKDAFTLEGEAELSRLFDKWHATSEGKNCLQYFVDVGRARTAAWARALEDFLDASQ